MSMNKSRLIDPQEEPCQSSANSGRMPEKDQDYQDNDDIPQEKEIQHTDNASIWESYFDYCSLSF